MRLNPAIRCQVRDYAIAHSVFLGVHLILLLVFAILASTLRETEFFYSGYATSCFGYLFVFGIIMPRQVVRLCAQFGVSRRTAFLSLFPAAALSILFLAAAGEVFRGLGCWVSSLTTTSMVVTDLYAQLYLDGLTRFSLGQYGLSILFHVVWMLCLFAAGLFLTFLFWRLRKTGCIIAALSLAAVLLGLPSLAAFTPRLFAPVAALLARAAASPWWAMALALALTVLFSLVGWLLIRRTNIRGGMLSK